MLENMREQRLGDANFANEADVCSVKCRHEWNARETTDPRSNDSVGEPPMCMNQLRLEAASGANSVDEIGTKESDQRESRAPGRGNVTRHVPSVGELLIAARCVSESLNADALDLGGRREAGSGRRYDANVHVFRPKRDGKAQYE
jgi:hypothetical protein